MSYAARRAASLQEQAARVAPRRPPVRPGREALTFALAGSRGRPLDAQLRARFEPAFGRSLGHVRVHDDAESAAAARAVDAEAMTEGSDVYLAPGRLGRPAPEGDLLLAHELAHVVQGTRGTKALSSSGDREEADAEAAATDVVSHGRLRRPLAAGEARIRRQTRPPAAGQQAAAPTPTALARLPRTMGRVVYNGGTFDGTDARFVDNIDGWVDSFLEFYEFDIVTPRPRGEHDIPSPSTRAKFAGVEASLGEIADVALEQSHQDGHANFDRGGILFALSDVYRRKADSGSLSLQLSTTFLPTQLHIGRGGLAPPDPFGMQFALAFVHPFHQQNVPGLEVSLLLPQVGVTTAGAQNVLGGGQLSHVWPLSSTWQLNWSILQALAGVSFLPGGGVAGQTQVGTNIGIAWVLSLPDDAQLQLMLQAGASWTHTFIPSSAAASVLPDTLDLAAGFVIMFQLPSLGRREPHPGLSVLGP